jgi:2-polyprenyl-6-methoxyphenol hydroxylase-like FAD-dependent oxidoreductase
MDKVFSLEPRYDAVIIGARCAGAATALLLARSAAKVLVVDRQSYGSDTLSTHALMRGAVLQLQRWGLVPEIVAEQTPPIRATTFHYGRDAVRVPIKPEHGVECLFAPRRKVLDRILVDAARNAGADVRHGVLLSELQFASDGRVIGVALKDAGGSSMTVRADIVIGADGRNSTVAQLVNARAYVEGLNASGIVFGYFENLAQDGSHWHFAKNAAAGVIPTNSGHCVFASVPSPPASVHETAVCIGPRTYWSGLRRKFGAPTSRGNATRFNRWHRDPREGLLDLRQGSRLLLPDKQ